MVTHQGCPQTPGGRIRAPPKVTRGLRAMGRAAVVAADTNGTDHCLGPLVLPQAIGGSNDHR